MKNRLENTEHLFEILNGVRYKSNEYFLKGKLLGANNNKIPTGSFNLLQQEGLIEEFVILDEESGRSRMVMADEAVNRFHPNTIDNKDFWVQCKEYFPLLSVCSFPSKSKKEVNDNTLSLPKTFGFLHKIRDLITASKEPLNFLEIGFGYGNIFDLVGDSTIYSGIDYTIPQSMKKHHELIEIDVSGIPKKLNKKNRYDIVYATNVLQHCSQKDRFDYFKQASEVLKTGGHFMFSCFVYADDNKDNHNIWGLRDQNGRFYTQFFSQMTEIDTEDELMNRLLALGFNILSVGKWLNCWGVIAQKI